MWLVRFTVKIGTVDLSTHVRGDRLAASWGNCVRSALQVLFVLYIYILEKALQPFDCVPAWEAEAGSSGDGGPSNILRRWCRGICDGRQGEGCGR